MNICFFPAFCWCIPIVKGHYYTLLCVHVHPCVPLYQDTNKMGTSSSKHAPVWSKTPLCNFKVIQKGKSPGPDQTGHYLTIYNITYNNKRNTSVTINCLHVKSREKFKLNATFWHPLWGSPCVTFPQISALLKPLGLVELGQSYLQSHVFSCGCVLSWRQSITLSTSGLETN